MEKTAIIARLTTQLATSLNLNADDLTPEAKLFAGGIIDSYATLELSIFIEDSFGMSIDEERIARLGTIEAIAAHISSSTA